MTAGSDKSSSMTAVRVRRCGAQVGHTARVCWAESWTSVAVVVGGTQSPPDNRVQVFPEATESGKMIS